LCNLAIANDVTGTFTDIYHREKCGAPQGLALVNHKVLQKGDTLLYSSSRGLEITGLGARRE